MSSFYRIVKKYAPQLGGRVRWETDDNLGNRSLAGSLKQVLQSLWLQSFCPICAAKSCEDFDIRVCLSSLDKETFFLKPALYQHGAFFYHLFKTKLEKAKSHICMEPLVLNDSKVKASIILCMICTFAILHSQHKMSQAKKIWYSSWVCLISQVMHKSFVTREMQNLAEKLTCLIFCCSVWESCYFLENSFWLRWELSMVCSLLDFHSSPTARKLSLQSQTFPCFRKKVYHVLSFTLPHQLQINAKTISTLTFPLSITIHYSAEWQLNKFWKSLKTKLIRNCRTTSVAKIMHFFTNLHIVRHHYRKELQPELITMMMAMEELRFCCTNQLCAVAF